MGQGIGVQTPANNPLAAMRVNEEMQDPTHGMSQGQLLLSGIGRGMANTARQIGNVSGIVPNSTMADYAKVDAPLLGTGAGKFGSMTGEAAALVPLTMGAEGAAGTTAMGAKLLASPVLRGIVEGAGQGALMGGPGNRAAGAVVGGATGGALPLGGRIVNAAAQGTARTPEAQLLLDRGVSLTPGQMNPKGSLNLLEQSVDRIPGVGPLIDSSRENAEQQFGRAVIQEGAAPGAAITPSHNINDMFDQAANSWDPVYAQVHGYPVSPQIVNQGANIPLSQALQQAARIPGLSGSRQRSINAWLQSRLSGLPQNPMSEDYIGSNSIRSAIRGQIRNLTRGVNAGQVDAPLMRDAYTRAESAVTQALESQLPPDAADVLRNADAGYAKLKVIENAVAGSKDQAAGLTPSKLSNAIAQSTDKAAYARGAGGSLRDLAGAGTKVFETTVPPTGVRTAAALGAAGLGYASPHVALPIMGAGAGGALLAAATPLGRRLAAGQTRPQRVAQQLTQALMGATTPAQRQIAALTARTALNRTVPTYLLAPTAPARQ